MDLDAAKSTPSGGPDEREAFSAGYQACMRDLNGPMTMERAALIWSDPDAAAAQAFDDPSWLDEYTDEWMQRPPSPVAPEPIAPRMGTIYVFRDDDTERFKIGWTSADPIKRMRAVQKAAGCSLSLVGSVHGTLADEKAVHRRFASARLHGEWFRITPDVQRWAYGIGYAG